MFKKLTAFVMALCVIGGTALYAPEKPVNTITASAEETESALTIWVYTDHAEVGECNKTAEGEIIIPAEVNGLPVTEIESSAFEECSSLTSIEIPESVTKIEYNAFKDCTSLASINIPDGVTEIGWGAFWGCSSLTSIKIPDSVTKIENDTFYKCSSLTSINISKNITEIGMNAFSWCASLTSINIPDSVTTIGTNAFEACTNLTSINIPNSVKEIKLGAFINCTGLTSLDIPASVENIGMSAFVGCKNLTSVKLSAGLKSIEFCAFANCGKLVSIDIPDSVATIGSEAFSGCTNLKKITILNPKCTISDSGKTISNGTEKVESAEGTMNIPIFDGTIYGYKNSTAQTYAEKYNYKFVPLDGDTPAEETVYGDANGDGDVSISDAVAILQNLANADEYPLSEQGKLNADVDGVAGVTGKDAAVIQMYDAGVVTSLPV